MSPPRRIVIVGLSITSSWGNGHASTWRGLMRELCARGHDVLFLERDVPWYRSHRDLPQPPFGETRLYRDFDELRTSHRRDLREADLVIIGSYVQEGIRVADWILDLRAGPTAFYDIDTPVTLTALAHGECAYLRTDLIPRFALYLSFAGGRSLERLEHVLGAPRARALYCGVDPDLHFPEIATPDQAQNRDPNRNSDRHPNWDLGYLGTYAADRQPALARLLLDPARVWPQGRFAVAGSSYPQSCVWPSNCARIDHLPPPDHRGFYGAQRFTLNVTRSDMVRAGHAPSVRLFEAAACGTPVISDYWHGLEDLFAIGSEVLIASSSAEVLCILRRFGEDERLALAARARARVLAEHTAAHRAEELERHFEQALARTARPAPRLGADAAAAD